MPCLVGCLALFMPRLALFLVWLFSNGSVSGIGLVVVVLAVLFDLGLLGTGESSRRSMRTRSK
jgi:hypothetical protein